MGVGGLTPDMSKMQTDFNKAVTPHLKHTHSQTQGLPQILYMCAPSSGKKSSAANFDTISVDIQVTFHTLKFFSRMHILARCLIHLCVWHQAEHPPVKPDLWKSSRGCSLRCCHYQVCVTWRWQVILSMARGGAKNRRVGKARDKERERERWQRWKVRKGELKVRDGERRVGLSVSLCLLQQVPPLQHLM